MRTFVAERVTGATRRARGSLLEGALVMALSLAAVSCGGTAVSQEPDSLRADGTSPTRDEDVSGAPAVSLEPTFDSPEVLARAFLSALEREDGAELKSYALTEEQFRHYVWPRLPSSRPERNVPFDFGWGDLYQKSHNSLLRTFARYRGESLEFLALRFEDGVSDFGTYVVHRDARIRVRRADGTEAWLDLFGSVMEWNGRYKLFSNVTD